MKSSQSPTRYLARASAGAWELWAFEPGSNPKKVNSADTCVTLDLPAKTVIALPSITLLAVPLWLASLDAAELRGMVLLQLESKGFGVIESVDFTILRNDGRQTLVVAWVLPVLPAFVAELDMIGSCAPSAFSMPMEDNTCTLWKETGRWSCAIRGAGETVMMQTLGALEIGNAMKSEVACLLGQMMRDKVLDSLPGEIRISGIEGEPPQDWPVPVRVIPAADPCWPDFDGFVPALFVHRRAERARKKLVRRVAALAASIAILAVAGFLFHTIWLWMTHERMLARVSELAPRVSEIRKSAESWNSVSGAVEKEQSAAEVLYRFGRHIPAAGLRFTLFQIKNGAVLIVGEADNVSGVVELQNKISDDKDLAEYRWKMPPPKILPTNVARFEISGDRLGYGSVQK